LRAFSDITRDETERKRAEDRRNSRLASLIANLPLGILVTDGEGLIELCNPALERLFLYSAAELRGTPYDRILSDEPSRPQLAPFLARVLNGESVVLQTHPHRKDGLAVDVEIYIVPLIERGKFAGAYGICQDISERLHYEHALRGSQEALRELSAQLLRTQDEERRRIGTDLHDSTGQNLAMLKMLLDSLASSSASPEIARQKLLKCISLADETIKQVRTTSYSLYPPMLEEVGLTSAIPWYLDGFMQRSEIDIKFEIPPEFPRPPRAVELAIFRVLQESLTNVLRHSGSKVARVKVDVNDGMVELEVADQGKGIPPGVLEAFNHDSPGKVGVGLQGMRERIRQLGGNLEVSSTAAGTVIRARVPAGKLGEHG
jgi:PAS domain S-box-containing protein